MKILAKRIYDYDKELAKRFEEWDKRIENLPDELKRMFLEWVDDGTLARILAQLILDEYATKKEVNELLELLNSKLSENINDNTKLIKQTKEDITKLIEKTKEDIDNELSRMNNDINYFKTDVNERLTDFSNNELLTMYNDINYFKTSVNERLNNFSNINSIEVLENITELNEKYPSGSDKIIVLKSDNHFYYYDENEWKKGNEFIQSNYKLVNNDGSMINLNLSDDWINNPDITTLDTGFYVAYLQNENLNEKYPSGSDKIIVLKSDNHFYYYDENEWKKGNEFIQSNYKLVNNDGSMINLNLSDDWINNPDITTLDTGFYVAYLQNENLN